MNQIKKYNRIKVELTEAGKQNAELAKHLGVTPGTVSDWCTNTNQPSVQNLFKIAEYLRIDVRKLLVSTDWDTNITMAAEKDPDYKKGRHKRK